ncbi:DNA repair protein RAD50 [Exophiala viscosa]|uniref:DNA repair protein RAD50 n=1 Tax=Exophiala viscosa TaxID=2486360 RepID=A0AAN6E1W1_9EURO|nr:DNA repair protein RAD50 [Exophiala viscosa]
MAGFAPAYQHESNDAWLNQVVNDIIDQASVRSRSLSRNGSNRSLSRSIRSPRGSVRSRSRSVATFLSAKSEKSRQAEPMQSMDHVPRTGSLSDETGSLHTGRETPRSMLSASPPPPAYTRRFNHAPIMSAFSEGSMNSESSAGRSTHALTTYAPETLVSGRVDRKPEIVGNDSDSSLTTNEKKKSWSDQESRAVRFNPWEQRIEPERRLSTVSEFSGFESHPAVRPLEKREDRKALGEAAGPSDDDPTVYPGPLSLALIVTGICLSVFIISLDRVIITTAIPNITARFHSYDDIGWYGSAYMLTASAFQPLYGRIYMSFQTKTSYLAALVIFEIGSVVAATSPSSNALIVGRAVQGLGSAGLLTGAFVVGTHSVRLQHRPVLFAGVGILYGVGSLTGPLIGGAFTDTIGWRWCFYLNLPIGAITFATVFLCFKAKSQAITSGQGTSFLQRVRKLDIIGNIILLGATTMLFLALQFSEQQYAWSSARVVGCLCGFGATLVIFIAWMLYRGDAALIPPRIVRQRTVAASCGAAFTIYGALLIHSYYLPIWFQAIKGTSAIRSGVDMIPYMVANAFFALLAGIFVSKNGMFAPPAILGCAIGTVGSGLLTTLKPTTPQANWIGYEFLISAGLGMAIQQGFSAVQASLPLEEVPIGTAAVVASQSLGGAIFVSVGNTLLQNNLLDANNDKLIPGVDVRAVIELGATKFRSVVPAKALPALVKLYNDSLQEAFIAAVVLCGGALICSLCMEWKSLKNGHSDGAGALTNEKEKNPSETESGSSPRSSHSRSGSAHETGAVRETETA